MQQHVTFILFLFMLGACIGSFLNVVVWRVPRRESLITPPSHCPSCGHLLPWYDNIPIFGWIKLGGKCRFCKTGISPRYPIVEAATALLFVFYYVMFYIVDLGPCAAHRRMMLRDMVHPIYIHVPLGWPMFLLYLFMASALLAASLIDADEYFIPVSIPWLLSGVGVLVHAVIDHPNVPGALNAITLAGQPSPAAALAAGGMLGLLLSMGARYFNVLLPKSFPLGDPLLEVEDRKAWEKEYKKAKKEGREMDPPPPEYTRWEIRREMGKEMLFLMPPMALGIGWYLLTTRVPGLRAMWSSAVRHDWVSGMLGALFGGLIGGLVVWITRILGTIGFGKLAMGLGDVDLMFGVGAIIGAGAATVAFFIAPFFGLLWALYLLISGKRREMPYGPYLSLGAGAVMLFYCRITDWLEPGLAGLGMMINDVIGRGG